MSILTVPATLSKNDLNFASNVALSSEDTFNKKIYIKCILVSRKQLVFLTLIIFCYHECAK